MNDGTEEHNPEKENEELQKELEKEKQQKERLEKELAMQRNLGYYNDPLTDIFYIPPFRNVSTRHGEKDEDSKVIAENKMSDGHTESNENSVPTTFTNDTHQLETVSELESFPVTAETPILSQPTHSFRISDLTTNFSDSTTNVDDAINDITPNLFGTASSGVDIINSIGAPSYSSPEIEFDDSTEDCCFFCELCSSCDDD